METPLELDCGEYCCKDDGLYIDRDFQLNKLTQKLGIGTSKQTFKNMTELILKNAAEMFMYLNICPGAKTWKDWFTPWSTFYIDLFAINSPDEIILTLNRFMNIDQPKSTNDEKIMKEIFRKATTLLSLKYETIQKMLPGVSINASKGENNALDSFDLKGKQYSMNI